MADTWRTIPSVLSCILCILPLFGDMSYPDLNKTQPVQGALQTSAWLDLTAGAGWRHGVVSVAAPGVMGHGHL